MVGRHRLIGVLAVVVVAVGACSDGGRAVALPIRHRTPGRGRVCRAGWKTALRHRSSRAAVAGLGAVSGGGRVDEVYYGLGRATAPDGVFVDVSASKYRTCGVRAGGALECWGQGFGDLPAGETFVQVSVAESSGGGHGCALDADGAVTCWGDYRFGQATAPEGEFVQVSVGADVSCALDAQAAVACWGADRFLDVPDGEFVQVYAGDPSCALDTSGVLVCWGGIERRSLPDAPAGSFSAVSVAAAGPRSGSRFGADYACGLRTSGTIACWAAPFGQGSDFGQADPPDGSFVSVSAGAERACAIDTEGRAVCWGNSEFQPDPAKERWGWIVNNYHCVYRRGYDYDPPAGPVDCRIYRGFRDGAVIVEEITQDDPYWDLPEFWGVYGGVADPLRGPFVQVSTGGAICGVRADAVVVCWSGLWDNYLLEGSFSEVAVGAHHWCALRTGADEFGSNVVCGRADNTREDWRNQTEAPAGEFSQIAAGDNHTCGLRTDRSVVCWGADYVGRTNPPSGEFVEVSAAGDSSCGLRTDHTAVCWGPPALVPPGGEFTAVSAAGHLGRPCGVRPDGRVVCWGYGTPGEPPAAAGPLVSASVGPRISCGVRTAGAPVCWDTHTKADLHLSVWFLQSSFAGQQVPDGEFVQAAVGDHSYCALRADATIVCVELDAWGGRSPDSLLAPPEGEFSKITAGAEHACAIRTDGTVACWGSDAEAQTVMPSPDG